MTQERVEDGATDRGVRMPARADVADLFARRRWIYWVDFGISYAVLCSAVVLGGWSLSWWSLPLLVVAALAFYRVGAFIHEVQHFRRGEFRSFTVVWNMLFGCVVGTPSVLYDHHARHHAAATFGTNTDPEYPDIPTPVPRRILGLAVVGAVRTQLLYIGRFTVGSLLRWLHPSLGRKVERKLSELPMDPSLGRPEFTAEESRRWLPYEGYSLACFTALAVLVVTGVLPWTAVAFAFTAIVLGHFTNFLRVLVVHGNHRQSTSRSFAAQIADSFDHPSAFVWMWGPVGLGYHGSHHLFPTMPYHALSRAHRTLGADERYSDLMSGMAQPGLVVSIRHVMAPDAA